MLASLLCLSDLTKDKPLGVILSVVKNAFADILKSILIKCVDKAKLADVNVWWTECQSHL